MLDASGNQAAKAWSLSALLGALALVGCAPEPQPVHFFADGRPSKLSAWQVLYLDRGNLALNDGAVPYDLNTPPFTDYAHKLRTIWMPRGTSAKYSADGGFEFPVGTIITKTFYYPRPKGAARDQKAVARTYDQSADFGGDPSRERGLKLANVPLIETPILVRGSAGCE